MTDRTISLIVTLEYDMRTDDAQSIVEAIKMIKHVSDVKVNVYSGSDQINAMAALSNYKHKILRKIIDLIQDK